MIPLNEIAVMVNLDMIGRLSKDADTKKDKVLLEGTGTAEIFEPLLDKKNTESQFIFVKKKVASGQVIMHLLREENSRSLFLDRGSSRLSYPIGYR